MSLLWSHQLMHWPVWTPQALSTTFRICQICSLNPILSFYAILDFQPDPISLSARIHSTSAQKKWRIPPQHLHTIHTILSSIFIWAIITMHNVVSNANLVENVESDFIQNVRISCYHRFCALQLFSEERNCENWRSDFFCWLEKLQRIKNECKHEASLL